MPATDVNSTSKTFVVDNDSALDAQGGSDIFRMEPAGGAKSVDAAPAAAPDDDEHSSLLETLGEDDPTGEGGRAPTAEESAEIERGLQVALADLQALQKTRGAREKMRLTRASVDAQAKGLPFDRNAIEYKHTGMYAKYSRDQQGVRRALKAVIKAAQAEKKRAKAARDMGAWRRAEQERKAAVTAPAPVRKSTGSRTSCA